MNRFGERLRDRRRGCRDPQTGRPLTQERMGELLGVELGDHGYSGQALSYWERGKSQPSVDDRRVLVAVLTVLHNCGGLLTLTDADDLLISGNYRPLNPDEKLRIFPGQQPGATNEPKAAADSWPRRDHVRSQSALLFFVTDELRQTLQQAREGPRPSWPRFVAALVRWHFDQLTHLHLVRGLIWTWVCLFALWYLSPSLTWPFDSPGQARVAMALYLAAALTTPLLVGVLTNTRDNEYWRQQRLADGPELRLYTYQGAFIGFQLGYTIVFSMTLVGYYLGVGSVKWLAPAIGLLPVGISYAGARLVPYNLWRAYSRLHLWDGAIFFTCLLLGPLWAYFFLEYYPLLLTPAVGTMLWLVALSLLAFMTTWSKIRSKAT